VANWLPWLICTWKLLGTLPVVYTFIFLYFLFLYFLLYIIYFCYFLFTIIFHYFTWNPKRLAVAQVCQHQLSFFYDIWLQKWSDVQSRNMQHMEWYHVCWPRLTAKRVDPVVSISWASCYYLVHSVSVLLFTLSIDC